MNESNLVIFRMKIYKPDPDPEPLREILSRLFTARGWGGRQGKKQLEGVWADAVGDEHAPLTRVLGVRRGVFEVEVTNAALMQELAHFHKRRLLQMLQERLPSHKIKDLRFKPGSRKIGKK